MFETRSLSQEKGPNQNPPKVRFHLNWWQAVNANANSLFCRPELLKRPLGLQTLDRCSKFGVGMRGYIHGPTCLHMLKAAWFKHPYVGVPFQVPANSPKRRSISKVSSTFWGWEPFWGVQNRETPKTGGYPCGFPLNQPERRPYRPPTFWAERRS